MSMNTNLESLEITYYPWCSRDEMLKNIYNKKYTYIANIIYQLCHDGYDRMGPKSNLQDITIWYKKNNKFYIDRFHSEEWYREEKPMFTLDSTLEIASELFWKGLMKHKDYYGILSEFHKNESMGKKIY